MKAASAVFAVAAAALAVAAASIGLAAAPPARAAAAGAPGSALPIRHRFGTAGNSEGWVVVGTGGGATATAVADAPSGPGYPQGGPALRFDYQVQKGMLGALALPIHDGDLTGAAAIRFLIRSDYDAPLTIALQENGGGRYLAMFTVPKDTWQVVELSPGDFTLSQNANDPPDTDNKLDLDQVNSVAIADVASIFAQAPDPALPDLMGIKRGPHRLFLADFTISADASILTGSATPAPPAKRPTQAPKFFDQFLRPQIDWLCIGQNTTAPRLHRGAPLAGRGMRWDYQQTPGKPAALVKPLGPRFFYNRTGMTFSVASTRAASLVIQLEEKGGGKYNTTIYVPAGATATTPMSLNFADFQPAQDSHDDNGKLDLDQVSQILILDATGLAESNAAAPFDNTLYLGEIRAVR